MSKKSPRPFATLLICLIALFVAGQGYASGLVLCIGEGDHFAIEQAFADKCSLAGTPCHEAELSCETDHCGPCRDIETSLEALHVNCRDHLTSLPPVQVVSAAPMSLPPEYVRYLTGNLFSQPPPRYPDSLIALRTTVLLI